MSFRQQALVAFAGGLTAGIAISGFSTFAEWLQVARHGSSLGMLVSVLLFFPVLGAFLSLPVLPFLLLVKRTRRRATVFLAAALSLSVGFLSLAGKPAQVRTEAFRRLADRAVPLVEAIGRYEREHKKAPASLADLVPRYLPSIPTTQMGVYPKFEYRSGPEIGDRWHGNPWVIYVETSRGFCNWDMFIYFPRQNYPEHGYGGTIEKIGRWAYVHE